MLAGIGCRDDDVTVKPVRLGDAYQIDIGSLNEFPVVGVPGRNPPLRGEGRRSIR